MRAQDLDMKNRHLRHTLHDCNHEIKDAKSQEATIKLLREKVREYEEKVESTLQTRSQKREQELLELVSDKERELRDSRLAIDARLEEAETKVAQLQSALESTQSELLDLKSRYDEGAHPKSDEMEIIVNDLERANQRAALAEQEAHHLKDQLVAAKQSLQLADQIRSAPDMERAVDVVARSSLELELAAKEKAISQLVDDIQRLQSTLSTLKESSASKIAQLEDMVSEKDKLIVELGEKLVKQQDYEEIKKELSILKSTESGPPRPWEVGEDSKDGSKTLSALLPERTKQPVDSLAPKVAKSEATGNLSSYTSPLQSVDSFGVVLGQELVSNYTQVVAKEERVSRPSTPKAPESSGNEDRKPSPPLESGSLIQNVTSSITSSPPLSTETSPVAVKDMVIPARDNGSLEKLQECLRHNIDKYANDTLNTLNIARCVRELLSVHNIGQRLFAKFVLGLSQGTVSELLSKPKPWDKLTEKGRDSYRKMHAWASDDHCIFMLKSLVPRRVAERRSLLSSPPGKESGGGSLQSYKQDDQGAEERIAQILNEAQMAMLNAKQQEIKSLSTSLPNGSIVTTGTTDTRSMDSFDDNRGDNTDTKSASNNNTNNNNTSSHNSINNGSIIRDLCTSNSSSPRRSRKYENDDIPQEMVARIYQEELAKLIGQRVEEGFRTPRDQYERTQEEIRQALTIYHQELTRLSHLMPQNHPNSFNPFAANGNTFAGSLTHHSNNSNSNGNHHHHHHHLPPPPQECPVDATIGTRTRSDPKIPLRDEPELRHHGSAFSLVRPKAEPNSTSSSNNNGSKTSSSSYHLHNSSPAPPPPLLPLSDSNGPPSSLPPTSGGATEDLSTSASPLQRMQSITNSLLSQSSVPSMPNPPQRPAKAVLPPITQQQFDQYNNLNTEDIVKKVKEQLSQYSISQRLFGESVLGLSQGSVSDLLARPKPWHMLTQKGREPFIRMKIFLEDDNAVHKLVASQYKIAPEKLMRTGGFAGTTPNPPAIPSYGAKMSPRPPEPNHRVSESRQPTPNNSLYSLSNHIPRTSCVTPDNLPISLTVNSSSNPPTSTLVNSRKPTSSIRGYGQPSVYEMAALTTDLDTQVITSKIKETLMAHNIGQKIFGEVVLGLSQGSVSELLSKPKPWHMLSIKGREPFIRMQMWLNDPHNVEMLQSIKNERREANKRRRTGENPMDSPRSQSDSMYGYNFAPPSPYPPAKKPRVLFTEEQKEALRLAFTLDPYPSTATIEFLATELNLSVRTITNWFHNHRMRMKQHCSTDDESSRKPTDLTSPVVPVREGMAFDPVQYRVLLSQRLAEKFREKGGPPFLSNFGGTTPYFYSPYRNCSPLSSSGDDVGTLDLSMSSQLRHAMNNGGGTKVDNAGSSTDDRSNSEINDDSNLSQDPLVTEDGSDRDSPDDIRSQRISPLRQTAEQPRLTTTTSSSSNRRKPAMPQWVDPGLELSPDSDVHSDDEEVDDDNEDTEIINGVCVRQTEDFDLLLQREEATVHIVPAPAPDAVDSNRTSTAKHTQKLPAQSSTHVITPSEDNPSRDISDNERDDEEMTNGNDCTSDNVDEEVTSFKGDQSRNEGDSKKLLIDDDDDESWDDAEAKDRRKNIEKLQQRLEKDDAGDEWEF